MEWYKKAYHRNVIDMHITDTREEFMSMFNPEKYVEMLELSKSESAVVYAQSHVGLCYYPTSSGEMHKGLKDRDVFGEIVSLCHKKNINVVAYYSLTHNNWAYDRNPDWRIVFADGSNTADKGRYGICCPNSKEYRDFTIAQINEICEGYEFEGIRFDMTFWPGVCYCRSCRERYELEVGGELPLVVDWKDPKWAGFQRRREEWLVDFAKLCTDKVRSIKPGVSVEHQSSTFPLPWTYGVSSELSEQNDFLQGDFYGDWLQGSFACKLLYKLTQNKPFGFETSSNTTLRDHTNLKSIELLTAKTYAALANGGAFIFIDAVDPVGTLNQRVYERINEIFKETCKYEKFIGGEMVQDVAIYLSTESKIDFVDNGKNVMEASSHKFVTEGDMGFPHIKGILSVTRTFIQENILFGVITKKNLKDLSEYKLLILSNVLMMDEEEAEAIRRYVADGGCVIASQYTSLLHKNGKMLENFMLADVFGADYIGETKEKYTYIAPEDENEEIIDGYSKKYPLGINVKQLVVKKRSGADALALTVLPYTDTGDIKRFSSIHSNPPGKPTKDPAIVSNSYGKGKAYYTSAQLECFDQCRDVFINMTRNLCEDSLTIKSDAPKPVEITVFEQEDGKRTILNLLNFQNELPNIPIEKISIKMKLGGRKVKKLVLLPDEMEVEYEIVDDHIMFTTTRLETFLMYGIYF